MGWSELRALILAADSLKRFVISDIVVLPSGFIEMGVEVVENSTAHQEHQAVCSWCRTPFVSGRKHSEYCKPACRTAAYRARLKEANDV